MVNVVDLFLHLDKYVGIVIENYGIATYLILFFVIFLENGLFFFTFFPGDTLIFIAGTFAASKVINVYLLFIILTSAAILGSMTNYFIGEYLGEKVIIKRNWINESNIQKTKDFFEKHGAKTIIIARFLPVIRSFAPFVAGIGKMKYSRFLAFSIIGAIIWVASMLALGYYFGSIPFIKNNLSIIILVIVVVSWIPPFFIWLKNRGKASETGNVNL